MPCAGGGLLQQVLRWVGTGLQLGGGSSLMWRHHHHVCVAARGRDVFSLGFVHNNRHVLLAWSFLQCVHVAGLACKFMLSAADCVLCCACAVQVSHHIHTNDQTLDEDVCR